MNTHFVPDKSIKILWNCGIKRNYSYFLRVQSTGFNYEMHYKEHSDMFNLLSMVQFNRTCKRCKSNAAVTDILSLAFHTCFKNCISNITKNEEISPS